MKISSETLEILKSLYSFTFVNDNDKECSSDEATKLEIGFSIVDGEINYIGKTIKATKKETTIDYIIDKIEQDIIYKNFSSSFNKIIKKFNLSSYPTTYGIGIWSFCNRNEKEIRTIIDEVLNTNNIVYTTEYSQAGYVYRYKISKSAENISKINKFCQL